MRNHFRSTDSDQKNHPVPFRSDSMRKPIAVDHLPALRIPQDAREQEERPAATIQGWTISGRHNHTFRAINQIGGPRRPNIE